MENIDKTKVAIDTLIQDNGFTQSEVVSFLKKRDVKISEATLSRFIRNPKYIKNLNKILHHVDSYLEDKGFKYNAKEKAYKTVNEALQSQKISLFFNTNWYLYFYDYRRHVSSGIGRAVVQISNKAEVKLLNINPQNATDYVGSATIHMNNKNLIINLNTIATKEKQLYMNFLINEGQLFGLNLGLFTNIGQDGLYGGTVILQKIEHYDSNMHLPKFFAFGTSEITEIPEPIRKFFRNKWQNELKITNGINSIEELAVFHIQNENKHFNTCDKSIEYQAYISMQISGTFESNSSKFDLATYLINKLTSAGQSYYFNGSGYFNPFTKKAYSPEMVLHKNLEALKASRCMIQIVDTEEFSEDALIELGYALKTTPIILFTKKNVTHFPSLLKRIGNVSHVFPIRLYDFYSEEELIDFLENNTESLFNWLPKII